MTSKELGEILRQLGILKLKQVGNNFTGLCPFHKESRPSWGISTDEPYFHNCFGCGAKGTLRTMLIQLGVDATHAKIISGDFELKGKRLPTLAQVRDIVIDVEPEEITPEMREEMYACYPKATKARESRAYLCQRNISLMLADELDLRYHKRHNRLLFPWRIYDANGAKRLVAVTGRAIDPNEAEKIISYLEGKKLSYVFHASPTVPSQTYAICEGEISGIALYQLLNVPVICTGRGNVSEPQLRYVRHLPFTRLLISTDWDRVGNTLRDTLKQEFKKTHMLTDLTYAGINRNKQKPIKDPADVLKWGSAKGFVYTRI